MTEVKICGVRDAEILDAVIGAGAEYFGLVFYPRSPRAIDIDTAAALADRGRRAGRIRSVALLVDPDDALVARISEEVRPDILQLHGHETPQRVRDIKAATGRMVMKAVSVATREDVAAAERYFAPGTMADLLLFDAKPPPDPAALPGGNGLTFDWRILEGAAIRHPFALAGGLTPENVAAAIELTGAAIADVSSGVESAPGLKDAALIRRFVDAAKRASLRAPAG